MSQSSTLSTPIRTSAGNDKSQTGLALAQKRFSSQDRIQPVVVYIGMAKKYKGTYPIETDLLNLKVFYDELIDFKQKRHLAYVESSMSMVLDTRFCI